MGKRRRLIFVALCLAAALSGCGGPFFISEADLRGVLGKEYLYASSQLGIDAFEIDTETGALTKLAGSPFGAGCTYAIAATLGGAAFYGMPYMYNQVHGYRVEEGGTLTDLWEYDPSTVNPTELISPTQVAVSPDGRFAYISHATTNGAVSGYSVDQATAALTYFGSTLGIGCMPVSIAVDSSGSNLYVSTTVPNSVRHLRVESGMPAAYADAVTVSATLRNLVAHPRGYLYGIVSGSSHQNIFGYQIDPVTGALNPVSGSPFRLGFGCSNLSGVGLGLDRAGQWLYATGNDYQLYAYRVDGDTGALTLTQGGLGSMNGGRIAASSSGRYVFVGGDVAGTGGVIRAYQVDSYGSLTEVPGSPFTQPSGTVLSMLSLSTFRLP